MFADDTFYNEQSIHFEAVDLGLKIWGVRGKNGEVCVRTGCVCEIMGAEGCIALCIVYEGFRGRYNSVVNYLDIGLCVWVFEICIEMCTFVILWAELEW